MYRLPRTDFGPRKFLTAVDGVSLTLAPSEFLGLVGESGSSKTTMASILTGVTRPDTGEVFIGRDRTEPMDLAAAYPERVADLSAAREAWAARCGVIPREKIVATTMRTGDPIGEPDAEQGT